MGSNLPGDNIWNPKAKATATSESISTSRYKSRENKKRVGYDNKSIVKNHRSASILLLVELTLHNRIKARRGKVTANTIYKKKSRRLVKPLSYKPLLLRNLKKIGHILTAVLLRPIAYE